MKFLRWIGTWLWKPLAVLKDNPVLFKTNKFTIVGFGLFASIEAMAVVLFFSWYLGLHGISALSIPLPLYALGGFMVWFGAKLFHWIALGKKFFLNPFKYMKETGFYMQGGVIGAFLWLIVTSVSQKLPFTILTDALCWGGLIGQAVGRLGCFNYGCCFGKPVKHGIGIHYTNKDSKIVRWKPELRGVKVHPTQLYMSGLDLLLFSAIWLSLPVIPSGSIFMAFMLWHGLTRVIIEQFRFDIYYHEGRNWTSFYTALSFALCPVVIFAVLKIFDPSFMKLSTLVLPVTLYSPLLFLVSSPLLVMVILSVGLLIFLGYGIHGKKLGTFPDLSLVHHHKNSETCSSETAHSGVRNV